ncbi:hypothetical protein C0583_04640 [Candidatus Parcubacteria bacterium]|nr:MAG: hypothetical protein C0583_04640 [Candidatus Parcubacteria bacterium]
MKINKQNWNKYRFNDISENISERVEPIESESEIYVGLEHLDSNSIHIKRHGHPSDVIGTKLKIYKGDVIFGKRRAYQRKAAIATFNGICSAHSMVLRAKSNVILPELFPFFLHSDSFMHRAIDISEGSLSPTIKWNILSKQNFLLPPIKQQKDFLELIKSVDDLRENTLNCINSLKTYKDVVSQKLLLIGYDNLAKGKYTNNTPSNWKTGVLGSFEIKWFKGVNAEKSSNGKYKLIPSGAVFPEGVKAERIAKINIDFNNVKEKMLQNGDILFNTGGQGTLGRTCLFNIDNGYFADSFVLVIRNKDKDVNTNFLFHKFNSMEYKYLIKKYTVGTTGITAIKEKSIKKFPLLMPPIKEQERITDFINDIDSKIINLIDYYSDVKKINTNIINSIF